MKMVTINMKQMESQKEVCELLKRELDFPDDFGGAVMKLYAELLGMEENTCVEMIQPEAGSPLESFGKEMESVMERAAQTVDFREEECMQYLQISEYISRDSPE